MTHSVRILLLIPHLGGGGAEQVTALLARGLSLNKYEVHLGLVVQTGAGQHALPPGVTVHPLGAARVRCGALRLLLLVRKLRPDVILSSMAHLNFLVLLLRPFFPRGTRLLVRQNATVSASLSACGLPIYTRMLYRLLYPRADRVICQSRAMAGDLQDVTGLRPERIAVLPNPVDIERILLSQTAPKMWRGPGPHLLAVGRLAPEKGFDLLLTAFAAVRKRFPTAGLIIAGAGSEEAALKEQCRTLSLERAVHFPGHVECPYGFYPGATLFVLSSRQEGMPNALLEAAVAGLPLVATPASGGVVDLLHGRPGAWLAPAVSAFALADTLIAALGVLNPGERFAHHFASRQDAHGLPRAIEAYQNLIDATLAGQA